MGLLYIFLLFHLNLCIIQLQSDQDQIKQMSKMPLGNVNVQHFNHSWKLTEDWKLLYATSQSSTGVKTWNRLGEVTDIKVVQKKVGLAHDPTPVLCFYTSTQGKVPVGMNPMLVVIKDLEEDALAGVLAIAVNTKSPGKVASK